MRTHFESTRHAFQVHGVEISSAAKLAGLPGIILSGKIEVSYEYL
jgi:hypothetical protein